jgi:hypothetical protein
MMSYFVRLIEIDHDEVRASADRLF